MFEIPNAKRVRRDELYDSSSDAETNSQDGGVEDAELRAKLNARLSGLLGLDLAAPEPATGHKADPDDTRQGADGAEDHEEKHEEEFEFRLFSTSSKAAAPAKVVLAASDDEDGPQGEGAFLVPRRPTAYYMAGEATPAQRERYQSMAVTGEDIIAGAGKRAWGLEKPWRVVKITVSSGKSPKGSSSGTNATTAGSKGDDGDEDAKKKRPGKKRRIAMRTKTKAEKAKRQAEEDKKMTKEEHLKEKKKRLNREKKLKRRAKEREQKLALKGDGEGQEGTPAKSAADSDTDASDV